MLTSWQLMLLIGSQVFLSVATLLALIVALKRKQSKLKCMITCRMQHEKGTQTLFEFEAINLKYIPINLDSCGIILPRSWVDSIQRKPRKKLQLLELNKQLKEAKSLLRIDEKIKLELEESILEQHLSNLGMEGNVKLLFFFTDVSGKYYYIPFRFYVDPNKETIFSS